MPSDDELLDQLRDTVVWTDLRMRLSMVLRADADRGDQKANAYLTFLVKHWPTGSVPRESELVRLRRDNNELSAMLKHATETLMGLNLDCPDFVDRLIRSGLDVPEHWRAV